jgi:hypothetical protein
MITNINIIVWKWIEETSMVLNKQGGSTVKSGSVGRSMAKAWDGQWTHYRNTVTNPENTT